MIALYLAAIVAANLLTARFGPAASIGAAAVLIGFDMTARDRLHEAWSGRRLVWRMGVLIAAGGFLSWLLCGSAGRVALASVTAFVLAGVVDAAFYHRARRCGWAWLPRVNGSNLASAAVDSLVFASLAFGGLQWGIAALQLGAKAAGGLVWSLLLRRDDHGDRRLGLEGRQ